MIQFCVDLRRAKPFLDRLRMGGRALTPYPSYRNLFLVPPDSHATPVVIQASGPALYNLLGNNAVAQCNKLCTLY